MATDAIRPVDAESDLGFGGVITRRHGYRLINRDGSFNVRVMRSSRLRNLFSYHTMITVPWTHFFAIIAVAYLLLNMLFAAAYLACGPGALLGDPHLSYTLRAFFFSVHTFATIGYGNVAPVDVSANVVVTIESLVGLTGMAVATGLVFARFSRPVPDVRYSNRAVIAPYRDITAFEFRVVNARRNQLLNVEANVTFSRFEGDGPARQRKFYQLKLERRGIAFFPLNWTVVHPIDEASPLWGWDKQMLLESEAEFAILLTGVDESFSQTVHSRSSYTADEVDFGYKFQMMYTETDQTYELDLGKLDAIVAVRREISA
jgi:inward rectifier potassium channel